MRDGPGIFFDGITSARHDVSVDLADEMLRIRDSYGMIIEEWLYDDIEQKPAPKNVLKLGLGGQAPTARLEIRDAAVMAAIDARARGIDRTGARDRRQQARIALWGVLASVSLVIVAVLVVPSLAARLVPYVPASVERHFGDAVNAQVRAALDTNHLGNRLACGAAPAERTGKTALDLLVAKLTAAAALPAPIDVSVVRRDAPNAFTVPGGHIYIFEGLLDEAKTPDELAGVIAHEMGHVAHRDGMRTILQGAGLSLLLGMTLGDFVGGGAVVIAARTLIDASYSRQVELAADSYGVRLVSAIGGKPQALAAILMRIEGPSQPSAHIWVDHPQAEERARAIDAMDLPAGGATLLGPGAWTALKHICAS